MAATTYAPRVFGGWMPITINPTLPITLTRPNGRNHTPNSQGPNVFHHRPCANTPIAVGRTYETYKKITHTTVIVEYTGVDTVNNIAAMETSQMATGGVRNVGDTHRTQDEAGRPPSRANAKAMRDAEVTVARPQKYCAITTPVSSNVAHQLGTTAYRVCRNAPRPDVRPRRDLASPRQLRTT